MVSVYFLGVFSSVLFVPFRHVNGGIYGTQRHPGGAWLATHVQQQQSKAVEETRAKLLQKST